MSSDSNITDKDILDVISWVEGDETMLEEIQSVEALTMIRMTTAETMGVFWIISPCSSN